MVFGREGNRLLVNGRERSALTMRSGAPQRWRIVNAAKSRYFQLILGDERFTQIGGDGGLQERAVVSDRLVLAPGERADVIVTPEAAPGTELLLLTVPFNRGYGSVEYRYPEALLSVTIGSEPRYTGPRPQLVSRTIEPLDGRGATEVAVAFTLDSTPMYGIDGTPFRGHKPVHARVGETQIWTVTNKTKWSHPFHLHGFFFQVLDEQGTPVRPLAWKDTIDVPFEKSVRLIVRFDDRPGSWMYHCHILDHADGGLMGLVELAGADGDPRPSERHHEHVPQ
jgi:FtsP/CotA-like multicopper oxidase with cupredoxin domain